MISRMFSLVQVIMVDLLKPNIPVDFPANIIGLGIFRFSDLLKVLADGYLVGTYHWSPEYSEYSEVLII